MHEWIVDHRAPPRSTDPEGVHCAKCGVKGLRWLGFFVVACNDPARALIKREWESWKMTRRVSNYCTGARKSSRPPPKLPV